MRVKGTVWVANYRSSHKAVMITGSLAEVEGMEPSPYWRHGRQQGCQVQGGKEMKPWLVIHDPQSSLISLPQSQHHVAWFLFSHSVMSDSFQPHGIRHTRLPCPSLSPGVCLNSSPLSRWCHPTTSSSDALFSFCLQSFLASGSFPMRRLIASGGYKVLALQLQYQFFQWIFRFDFL